MESFNDSVPCQLGLPVQVLRGDLHGGHRVHFLVHGLVGLLPRLDAPPDRRQTREATCRFDLLT